MKLLFALGLLCFVGSVVGQEFAGPGPCGATGALLNCFRALDINTACNGELPACMPLHCTTGVLLLLSCSHNHNRGHNGGEAAKGVFVQVSVWSQADGDLPR